MQKVSTRIFVVASLTFGVVGLLMVLTSPARGDNGSDLNVILQKILMACVFVILPSFALSVASKYLGGKS